MTLDATDRCDRCSARAVVVTSHAGGHLYWCGHHATRYAGQLGLHVIVDNR